MLQLTSLPPSLPPSSGPDCAGQAQCQAGPVHKTNNFAALICFYWLRSRSFQILFEENSPVSSSTSPSSFKSPFFFIALSQLFFARSLKIAFFPCPPFFYFFKRKKILQSKSKDLKDSSFLLALTLFLPSAESKPGTKTSRISYSGRRKEEENALL